VLDTNGNALGHAQDAPCGNACTVLLSLPYVSWLTPPSYSSGGELPIFYNFQIAKYIV